MEGRSLLCRGAVAALVSLAALPGCAPGPERPEVPTAQVRRGDLVERVLLSGELEAVRSTRLLAPRTPEWQVQIIEIFPEGEACREGEVILRFDQALTNRELLRSTQANPILSEALAPVTVAFDRVWYGFEPLTQSDYETLVEQVETLNQL